MALISLNREQTNTDKQIIHQYNLIMMNFKKLIDKFQSLKGAKLISVNNYIAKTSGEVANHVVNVNISVLTAKKNDLETLKACTDDVLTLIANSSKIAFETVKLALTEMTASSEKNLSAKKEDRTKQSQGQSDAYIFLTPAIRLHKETFEVSVFGQGINKTVIEAGEYADKKAVNSSDKTIAKKLLTKELNLRAGKYRSYLLGHVDNLKVMGEVINC
jgi:hypothetical protein